MNNKNPKAKTSVRKPKKSTEEKFRLTPKGIFYGCIMDAFSADYDDRRISIAWELFDARMHKNGYVQD